MSGVTLDAFRTLFTGLDRAFGQLHNVKDHMTVKGTPDDTIWESHLKGDIGLGIVPIRDEGECFFGVIDIDVKDITHQELAQRVEKLGLPLYVCASKGKGYHCYFFFERPGKQAPIIRGRLRQWAVALGYPGVEVFPKQDFLTGDATGNWINLPYFGGYTKTTRYCMTAQGKELGLDEFLEHVKPWNPDVPLPLPVVHGNFDDAPPCLEYLMENGVPAGTRNNGMYNIGVFLKKAYPEAWREQMRTIKSPPLDREIPDKELGTIIKSLQKREYFYKCEEEPIQSVCNKPLCLTRKFGIGHGNQQTVAMGFSHPDFQVLEKLDTKPPRYYLTVNAFRLDLSTDELIDWNRLRKCLFEALDELPANDRRIEQEWQRTLAGLMATITVHEVPPEASDSGQVLEILEEWSGQCSEQITSLLRGDPYHTDGHVYIHLIAFEQLLKAKRLDMFKTNELVSLMKMAGWKDAKLKSENKIYKLWAKEATRPKQSVMSSLGIVDQIDENKGHVTGTTGEET